MFARLSTFQIRDGSFDHVMSALRNQAVPAFQAMTGCRNVSVFSDRASNRIAFMSEWDLREQAAGATEEKYRLAALERVQPDIEGPLEIAVYEVSVRA